ncbi:hypothetical protein JD844_013011, partial [Phrynosoma platyrhinos]
KFCSFSPVPSFSWRRTDGNPLAQKINTSTGILEIPDFQKEDEATYECIAVNVRGRNAARGQLLIYALPEWNKRLGNAHVSLYDTLVWECEATGKPMSSYQWLKNGQPLTPENGTLTITMLNISDSGLYQCVAENKYGSIYSNAELTVIASAPDFSKNPIKKISVVHMGGEITIRCKPEASPKAVITWKKRHGVSKTKPKVSL